MGVRARKKEQPVRKGWKARTRRQSHQRLCSLSQGGRGAKEWRMKLVSFHLLETQWRAPGATRSRASGIGGLWVKQTPVLVMKLDDERRCSL